MRRSIAFVLLSVGIGACTHTAPTAAPSTPASGSPSTSPAATEAPVSAEKNPPGDIPDSQVFVTYRSSAGGFSLKVPEGWARREPTAAVSFSDKLNMIRLTWQHASSAPTVQSARSQDVPALQNSERAFELVKVEEITLPSGSAVLITYRANSAPNDVTGRQYRLDVLRFELYRSGTEVVLTLSSPVGADNVDPWRIVSRSFSWR